VTLPAWAPIVILLSWPAFVSAQTTASSTSHPPSIGASLTGLLSFQPKSETYQPPYLDSALGGTVPGLALALQYSATTWPTIGVEVSSTRRFEAVQSGRLVAGEGQPVASTHRDTLVSVLLGLRVANGLVEPKIGGSLVFARLQQGDVVRSDLGSFAFTAGFDVVAGIGTRVDLVPSIRYSYVFRQTAAEYAGLGHPVVRAGIGARVRF